MKTRIGSSRRSLRRTLLSDNSRLVKPAQERLDNILSRVNDRHDHALSVDGVELTLWRRQRAGYICTCYDGTSNPNSVIPVVSSDDITTTGSSEGGFIQTEVDETDGSVQVDSRIDFTLDDTNYSIVSLRDDRRARNNLRPQADLLEDLDFAKTPTQKYFPSENGSSDIDLGESNDGDLDPEDNIFDIDEEFEDFEGTGQSDDDRARLTRSVEALLSGGESAPCGICFSSGWTEGYQLFNGRRIVLHTQDVNNLGGFTVDHSVRPSLFKGRADSDPAEWLVDLPKLYHSVLRIQAWNNLTQISNIQAMVKFKDTSDFAVLTPALLMSRSGMDNTGATIRACTCNIEGVSPAEFLYFSHLEIIIEQSPKIVGQIPQVEIAETFEYYEAIIQTNIEWPSRISNIETGSVCIDAKHKRAWRIVAVNQSKTSDSKVFALETQAMMLQQKEPLERLNIYRKRYVTPKNYKGLEIVQGSRQTGG